jgi:ABC-type nitrate/sulfonate/bicarbonate transport system ATPase subunit
MKGKQLLKTELLRLMTEVKRTLVEIGHSLDLAITIANSVATFEQAKSARRAVRSKRPMKTRSAPREARQKERNPST